MEVLRSSMRFWSRTMKREGFRASLSGEVEFAVIVDNRFPDFFAQISFLFSSGFLAPARTAVIAKEHRQSRACLEEGARKYGFALCFFRALTDIPSLPGGTIVFYPYNGQANYRVLQERHCIHIFIGHGDSNKAASVHPLLRAYDHVLLCGTLAQQRLFASGIFREDSIEPGRMIMLGDTVIGSDEAQRFAPVAGEEAACVLWAPTWEGGIESANYSSVAEGLTPQFILGLCKKLNLERVWIDFHPNLGARRPAYGKHLSEIVEQLAANGLRLQIPARAEQLQVGQFLKNAIRRGLVEIDPRPAAVRHAVVDVSAMETLMAVRGIPSSVFWRESAPIHASAAWWKLRRDHVVRMNTPESAERVLEQVETPEARASQEAFNAGCCGYEDDELRGKTHERRAEWLVETVRCYRNERVAYLQTLAGGL